MKTCNNAFYLINSGTHLGYVTAVVLDQDRVGPTKYRLVHTRTCHVQTTRAMCGHTQIVGYSAKVCYSRQFPKHFLKTRNPTRQRETPSGHTEAKWASLCRFDHPKDFVDQNFTTRKMLKNEKQKNQGNQEKIEVCRYWFTIVFFFQCVITSYVYMRQRDFVCQKNTQNHAQNPSSSLSRMIRPWRIQIGRAHV